MVNTGVWQVLKTSAFGLSILGLQNTTHSFSGKTPTVKRADIRTFLHQISNILTLLSVEDANPCVRSLFSSFISTTCFCIRAFLSKRSLGL
jgi:hypothetical protein